MLERALFGAGRQLRPLFGDQSRAWHAIAAGPKRLVNRRGRPAPAMAEVDIFHSLFSPLPETRGGGAAAQVLTIWDLLPLTMPEHFPDAVGRRAVARAARSLVPARGHAICTSAAAKADLVSAVGIDPARVHVVPLAASAALFQPVADPARIADVRRTYGIPAGHYLLSLGAIDSRKNLPHLVRCFRRLQAERDAPPATLVIAGEYTERHRGPLAEVQASSAGEARIVFTGRVADADLAALYSGARAFVFPSLGEGFGLPPLEAMQCGTPVICSTAPALPEVTGDAALGVAPRDEAALVAALRAVLENDALASDLSQRSRQRAAQFSWRRTVAETVGVYERLLTGST
ncbi:MAG TPA: glycosyltransferase family 1 protein [Dehalococcoidia bacterium]|nr:glycosyltransferase family 1 protein [Dehalococcoidia bacterium]